jgi:thiol-disulfide isomerase/thioredoxin
MRQTFATIFLAGTLAAVAGAGDAPKADAPPAKPQPKMIPAIPLVGRGVARPVEVQQVQAQYQEACERFVEALHRAGSPEKRAELAQTAPNPEVYAVRAARLAAAQATDEPALDALLWLTRFLGQPAVMKALEQVPGARPTDPPAKVDPLALLAAHHLNNPKLADLCQSLAVDLPGAEAFLRAAADKSAAAEVRGRAGYRLAATLLERSEGASRPESERQELAKAAEGLFERIAADPAMAGVKSGTRSLKALAEGELKEMRLLAVGKPLPDVTGEGLDGKALKVSDYKGKVVVLDVWATWCGPCKAMIPHEREMVKRLEGKPFALISVSCDEEKGTLAKFLEKTPMPWTHWWVGTHSGLGQALNIRFYPTIYVLDAQGVIRHKNIRGEKLEAAVVALLREAAKGGE